MSKHVKTIECPKCGYIWMPRKPQPKRCPRCGYWLIPKPKGDNR
jgi:DNA-directed RNA polymerase subunit RPC12/RpoP